MNSLLNRLPMCSRSLNIIRVVVSIFPAVKLPLWWAVPVVWWFTAISW